MTKASHPIVILQDAISRVQTLEEEGRITGVMDDRGKFIYISRDEMAATAEYIMGRGRIAISELAAKCSSFIDLEPKCATHLATLEQPLATMILPRHRSYCESPCADWEHRL